MRVQPVTNAGSRPGARPAAPDRSGLPAEEPRLVVDGEDEPAGTGVPAGVGRSCDEDVDVVLQLLGVERPVDPEEVDTGLAPHLVAGEVRHVLPGAAQERPPERLLRPAPPD